MIGLPEGVSLSMVLGVLIPVALVTVALRALPFVVRQRLGESGLVRLLGVTMPVGVMTVLVVYTLHGSIDPAAGLVSSVAPGMLGIAATMAVQAWWRRPAVSILVGTLTYMVLVNLVF